MIDVNHRSNGERVDIWSGMISTCLRHFGILEASDVETQIVYSPTAALQVAADLSKGISSNVIVRT